MRKPDYLIIGTMKGGTTILHDFICDHPEVSIAEKKEIHYFSLYYDKGEEWYSGHFKGPEKTIIGEASPTYFDMSSFGVLPKLIKNDLPDVKIILIVRDPVARAISHYNHFCTINKIEMLQEIGAERFFNLPYSSSLRETEKLDSYLFQVLNFSCYRKKFAGYKRVFGENILVLNNKDLRQKPQGEMEKVFNHLSLSAYESPLFKEVRYSSGTSSDQVSNETLRKLSDFLYPDFEKFCKIANLDYQPDYV